MRLLKGWASLPLEYFLRSSLLKRIDSDKRMETGVVTKGENGYWVDITTMLSVKWCCYKKFLNVLTLEFTMFFFTCFI